jgi:hypothetical protein
LVHFSQFWYHIQEKSGNPDSKLFLSVVAASAKLCRSQNKLFFFAINAQGTVIIVFLRNHLPTDSVDGFVKI